MHSKRGFRVFYTKSILATITKILDHLSLGIQNGRIGGLCSIDLQLLHEHINKRLTGLFVINKQVS